MLSFIRDIVEVQGGGWCKTHGYYPNAVTITPYWNLSSEHGDISSQHTVMLQTQKVSSGSASDVWANCSKNCASSMFSMVNSNVSAEAWLIWKSSWCPRKASVRCSTEVRALVRCSSSTEVRWHTCLEELLCFYFPIFCLCFCKPVKKIVNFAWVEWVLWHSLTCCLPLTMFNSRKCFGLFEISHAWTNNILPLLISKKVNEPENCCQDGRYN